MRFRMKTIAKKKLVGLLKKRIGRIGDEQGVTLLEVMVSMLVISIGLMGLAPLIGVAIQNNTYSFDIDSANSMAREEMESLLQRPSYPQMPFTESRTSPQGTYSVSGTVDDYSVTAAVPDGVFRIRVRVDWIDQANIARSVEYAVFKAKA